MALSTRPRDRARHAAPTSWRQKLFGRRNVVFDAPAPLRRHRPALPAAAVPTGEDYARAVIARLVTGTNLYALDWRYGDGHATAHVDPGLVPDAARDVLTAYATALGSMVLQEEIGDRTYLRTSRAVDGVLVTVRADVTPIPVQPPQPAPAASPAPPQEQQLPIERLAHCALDDTQVFDPITDDTPAPDDDTGAEDTVPDDPEPDTPVDGEDTASDAADDTSSTPLPQGTEDTEEEDTLTNG